MCENTMCVLVEVNFRAQCGGEHSIHVSSNLTKAKFLCTTRPSGHPSEYGLLYPRLRTVLSEDLRRTLEVTTPTRQKFRPGGRT